MRPLFDNHSDYDRFINAVTAENRMYETRFNALRGSQTAGRVAEDNSGTGGAIGHAVRGGLALSEGAPGAATLSFLKAAGALSRGESPAVNAAAARMLTTPATSPAMYSNLARIMAAQELRNRRPIASASLSAAAGAGYPSLTNVLTQAQGSQP